MYLSMLACMLVSLAWHKIRRQKSWEHLSVLVGIYMVKGGMLIGGTNGPAFYTCLLIIIYNLSQICYNRAITNESDEGFSIIMFFVLWLIQLGFYRTGHREDFTAI